MDEKTRDPEPTLKEVADLLNALKVSFESFQKETSGRLTKLEACVQPKPTGGSCDCSRCKGQRYGNPVTWIPIPWINPCWWMTWCPPPTQYGSCCHHKDDVGIPKKGNGPSSYRETH